jgi:hypothetical protein
MHVFGLDSLGRYCPFRASLRCGHTAHFAATLKVSQPATNTDCTNQNEAKNKTRSKLPNCDPPPPFSDSSKSLNLSGYSIVTVCLRNDPQSQPRHIVTNNPAPIVVKFNNI